MTIAQGTVLKAVVGIDMPGSIIAQNIFYYKVIGINPVSEAGALTAAVTHINNLFGAMNNQIVSGVALDTVKMHEWDWNAVDEVWETGRYIGEAALSDSFANASEMLPHAVAGVVTGKTGDVNTISRKSFAGFGEDQQSGSDWVAAALTALANAAAFWLAASTIFGADALQPTVPNKDGVAEALLTSLVGSVAGSQRRRKPGLGV